MRKFVKWCIGVPPALVVVAIVLALGPVGFVLDLLKAVHQAIIETCDTAMDELVDFIK